MFWLTFFQFFLLHHSLTIDCLAFDIESGVDESDDVDDVDADDDCIERVDL